MKKKYKEILGKSSILLVEDEDKIRANFKEALLIYSDNVYEASNGEDALELFHANKPDIVITDVKMSIMDGLELTSVIRRLKKDIPIVVVSAYREADDLMKFISLNLMEYLLKPVTFEQLEEVLEKCARGLIEKGLVEYRLSETVCYSFSKKALVSENGLITLSPKEIGLIELLINNRNKLVTKEVIEDTIYDGDVMSVSALNNLTSKLRKKIGTNVIMSVSNMGFLLAGRS